MSGWWYPLIGVVLAVVVTWMWEAVEGWLRGQGRVDLETRRK